LEPLHARRKTSAARICSQRAAECTAGRYRSETRRQLSGCSRLEEHLSVELNRASFGRSREPAHQSGNRSHSLHSVEGMAIEGVDDVCAHLEFVALTVAKR